VLDTAQRLIVVETDHGPEGLEVPLDPASATRQAARIRELHLDVLVCGAVSSALAEMLTEPGMNVIPWISGEVDGIVRSLASGGFDPGGHQMPGCCGRRRRRGAGGPGSGRGCRRGQGGGIESGGKRNR
jgi:predicted Fe-Mo cluster-binding NifX family protein